MNELLKKLKDLYDSDQNKSEFLRELSEWIEDIVGKRVIEEKDYISSMGSTSDMMDKYIEFLKKELIDKEDKEKLKKIVKEMEDFQKSGL